MLPCILALNAIQTNVSGCAWEKGSRRCVKAGFCLTLAVCWCVVLEKSFFSYFLNSARNFLNLSSLLLLQSSFSPSSRTWCRFNNPYSIWILLVCWSFRLKCFVAEKHSVSDQNRRPLSFTQLVPCWVLSEETSRDSPHQAIQSQSQTNTHSLNYTAVHLISWFLHKRAISIIRNT